MIKLFHILLLSTCLLNGVAHAAADEPEVPNDFAYGAAIIDLSTDAPFYKFKLPEQVYLNTAHADLRDIRVFNNRGSVLPFSLQRVQYQQQKETSLELTLVPLTPNQIKQNKDGYHIEIQSSGNAALNTTIKLEDSDWDKANSSLYLVKLPQTDKKDKRQLDRLVLKWQNLNQTWQAKLSVSSEDHHEYTLLKKAQVSELVTANEHLALNRIELNDITIGKETDFLLLNLQLENGEKLPEITAVEGISVSNKTQEDQLSLNFPLETETENEAIYSFPNEQSISSLRITPQQNNSVYPVSIEYKTQSSTDWLPLAKTMSIYRFDADNQTAALKLHQKNIKQLRIKTTTGNWGKEAPEVLAQRDAMYVFFNAQGHQNLLLAWGAIDADNKALSIEQLIPNNLRSQQNIFESNNIKLAKLDSNNILDLGGESRLTDSKFAGKLSHKYLLWGLLLLGVAILGYLAFKLWGDIQKANKDNS